MSGWTTSVKPLEGTLPPYERNPSRDGSEAGVTRLTGRVVGAQDPLAMAPEC